MIQTRERRVTLNIRRDAPEAIRKKAAEIFSDMPYWDASAGFPHWTGDGIALTTSSEWGGVQILGNMPDGIWETWYKELTDKLSDALGYQIGDRDKGFQFKYWETFIKRFADIKNINERTITFQDGSQFDWTLFERIFADEKARPMRFECSSPLITLYIVFDDTESFSQHANRQNMKEFRNTLGVYGIQAE